MLDRNDVVWLMCEDCVILMEQAVFTPATGALAYELTQVL
jgi:hypothetical protein